MSYGGMGHGAIGAPASSDRAFGPAGVDIFGTYFVCPMIHICQFWGMGHGASGTGIIGSGFWACLG
ncbi:MAG: hypothetical protein KME26_01860 [Oscillatoria princeps RMCB-10]|nr:hypothetical protein [Oscillatoria princeps RMCB-10]